MFSQAPRPYETTSEYPVRTWSRPIAYVPARPNPDKLQGVINEYLIDPDRHIVSLSHVACEHGIWYATIVSQTRTEEEN